MIIYASLPIALEDTRSIRKASQLISKFAGKFAIKEGGAKLFVNPIFSLIDGNITKGIATNQYFSASKCLIDSCQLMVHLRTPGWDYCPVMQLELEYALFVEKPVIPFPDNELLTLKLI